MKIKMIEFENFRNFKDYGKIECSIDGKVTIVYGKNGDGKTTLHQLFKWVFYGEIKFNKTATDRLYNLEFEKEQSFNSVFSVMGRIDFEHADEQYSLTRTETYRKGITSSDKISEEVILTKMDSNNDWKKIEQPRVLIEKLLPSELAEYFFFDGESMIADLKVKGRDSASKLRKALYSMFDLDVLELAKNHIGKTSASTTVLGKLYIQKAGLTSSGETKSTKVNIENSQAKIESISGELKGSKDIKKDNLRVIKEISEKIGTVKSKAEYEKERNQQKNNRDLFLKNAQDTKIDFGSAIMEMMPRLFISKAILSAKEKINLKIEDDHLPKGLGKDLIHYLLSDDTEKCVCGTKLTEKEKSNIESYLKLLPPKSYANLYNDFNNTAIRWGTGYNKEKIEDYIMRVFSNRSQASKCDEKISLLDEEEKKNSGIEDLVLKREEAENYNQVIDDKINKLEADLKIYDMYLKKEMNKFDKLTQNDENSEKIKKQMDIMESVKYYFESELERASVKYSENLQTNIQALIDQMLTSKRKVEVNTEFSVRVIDSYNDESKSEGQFAVVSFAYIGGILRMLQNENNLGSKEYPLVLDGPFSKLDGDQRRNVVEAIPEFAQQVILFSKDDLHTVVPKENIGKVWTIQSNDEKNVAFVKEGYLWK